MLIKFKVGDDTIVSINPKFVSEIRPFGGVRVWSTVIMNNGRKYTVEGAINDVTDMINAADGGNRA